MLVPWVRWDKRRTKGEDSRWTVLLFLSLTVASRLDPGGSDFGRRLAITKDKGGREIGICVAIRFTRGFRMVVHTYILSS